MITLIPIIGPFLGILAVALIPCLLTTGHPFTTLLDAILLF